MKGQGDAGHEVFGHQGVNKLPRLVDKVRPGKDGEGGVVSPPHP